MSRRRLLALTLLACLTCLGGCSAPPGQRTQPAPLRLDASVTQFRFDEGTRNLKAGVTNNSDREIRGSRATIVWDGLAFPTVPEGARSRLVAAYAHDVTEPHWALGWRWDIVLAGSNATVFEARTDGTA